MEIEAFLKQFPPITTPIGKSKDDIDCTYLPPFVILHNTPLKIDLDELHTLYQLDYNDLKCKAIEFSGNTYYATQYEQNRCICKDGSDNALVVLPQQKIMLIGVFKEFSMNRRRCLLRMNDQQIYNVIFGSITGYVGFYQVDTQELKYIPEVFEEIIRAVRFEGKVTYIVVGDFQGLVMDTKTKEFASIRFDKRPHNQSICSSTLSMYAQQKVLMMAVAPTQNKDIGVDISTKKNSLYIMDMMSNDMNSLFVEMPSLCVPFDFDGRRLLLLEYMKQGKKCLSMVNFDQPPVQVELIYSVNPNVEFISMGRLCRDSIIYVENHKILKSYHLTSKLSKILYISHAQIMALDSNDQHVAMVDYEGNVVIMYNENIICNFNIHKVPQFAQELIKHRYIFDMGYPYYIRFNGNRVIISHDLGIVFLLTKRTPKTPITQSLSVRRTPRNQVANQNLYSLSVDNKTRRNFFNEPAEVKPTQIPELSMQGLYRDIQNGHSSHVIEQLERQAQLSKPGFLVMALAHKNLRQWDKAKTYLIRAVKEHPGYHEAYVQLGAISMKQGHYQVAMKQFDQAVMLGKTNLNMHAYLNKARCHQYLKQHKQALEIYERLKDLDLPARVRQIASMTKCGHYDDAMFKVNGVLIEDPDNAEATMWKGAIQFRQKQLSEAILTLEQCIQLSSGSYVTAKALQYLIKIKIILKDFYAANLYLQRALRIKKSFKFINLLGNFVQGTICLMKRTYSRGLQYLLDVRPVSKFLQPIYNQYLAFAYSIIPLYSYFCVSNYTAALSTYQSISRADEGTRYNRAICQALVHCGEWALYDQALLQLDEAICIYPQRMEPYFYKATIAIQKDNHNGVTQCEQYLDQAFSSQGKQPNLFYARAILKAFHRRFSTAIKEVEKAIDKCEDNIVGHFYLRGTLHGQSMSLKQAIKDFSTAIHFNNDHGDSYLQRAKCYQIMGDSINAFNDINKYGKIMKKSDELHYWSGSLQFHNNQYEDACKSYNNLPLTRDIGILKIKCLIKTQSIDRAIQNSNILCQEFNEKQIVYDNVMLQFIKQVVDLSSNKNEDKTNIPIHLLDSIKDDSSYGHIFKQQDYRQQRAASLIYLKKVPESIEQYSLLEKFWMKLQQDRQNSIQSRRELVTDQSEESHSEMILKAERIVQHVVAIKYNLMVIYMMIHKYKLAYKMMHEIREQIGDVQSDELDYLSQTIVCCIEKKQPQPYHRMITLLMNDKSVFNYFPTLRISVSNTYFDCKLSLSLPDIQPPNICPGFNTSYIMEISPSLVDNKPEAPWLQRTPTLQFTDKLLTQDIQLTTEEVDVVPEPVKKKKKNKLELDERLQKKLERMIRQQ